MVSEDALPIEPDCTLDPTDHEQALLFGVARSLQMCSQQIQNPSVSALTEGLVEGDPEGLVLDHGLAREGEGVSVCVHEDLEVGVVGELDDAGAAHLAHDVEADALREGDDIDMEWHRFDDLAKSLLDLRLRGVELEAADTGHRSLGE